MYVCMSSYLVLNKTNCYLHKVNHILTCVFYNRFYFIQLVLGNFTMSKCSLRNLVLDDMLFILISLINTINVSLEKFIVPENPHTPLTKEMFGLTPPPPSLSPPRYSEIPINLPPAFLTMTFSCKRCEYFLELQKLIKTKLSTSSHDHSLAVTSLLRKSLQL